MYVGAAHGNYNAEVEQAVVRFQEARAIGEESGVYGPVSRRQVEAETSDPDQPRERRAGPDRIDRFRGLQLPGSSFS
ncbi:hypothetical protein [Streptomyces sp. NBC_01304]|uniref:hypothetical protein n=1 Tax=Streptomyces sp. NBC_01304 TaxID=2903818 RepID=UPI002E0F6A51|nr:hypothetical protein OG430_00435 [Streptomyces sp. NBC_01304]